MSNEEEEILSRPVPVEDEDAQRVRLKIRRRVVGRRLDKYLHGRFPRLSRTLIQRLIKQGAVTVNDKLTKSSYEPDAGDVVDVLVPPPEPTEIVPEDISLNVVYEDAYLLAINKHVGIICHPARAGQTGTIANAAAYYAQQLSRGEHPFRPGIVHRLDKNTSGIMLIAKTDEAHWRLSLQFERRTVQKTYRGIVEGEPQLDADIIDQPLSTHPRFKDTIVVTSPKFQSKLAKEAITRYEVVERYRGFTLVDMFPKTGRTHQLRVHMSSIGHPMLGDVQYGGHLLSEEQLFGEGCAEPVITYQSLHARRISFRHPILETPMELEAPLTDTLKHIVELMRKYRSY